jgi:hypothetical protein
MSLVAALVPDLDAWTSTDRQALVAIMRAKGGGTEMDYARRLDRHQRLCRLGRDSRPAVKGCEITY